MIICQNCGTTNNEAISHTCRTCGALLPVSSKSTRSKRLKADKKKKEKKEIQLELHEIPKDGGDLIDKVELPQIPEPPIEEFKNKTSEENEIKSEENKSEILKEIPAPPYKGTLINSQKFQHSPPSVAPLPSRSKDAISDTFSELKSSVLED